MNKSFAGKLHCVHILASTSDAAAGPSYSVPALCNGLEELGATVRLRDVRGWRETETPGSRTFGFQVSHPQSLKFPPFSNLCHSRALRDAIYEDAESVDVLHSHGLWLMPNLYPAWAVRQRRGHSKLIFSPRGMLGEEALRFSRRKKALFWALFQQKAAETAAVIHATSAAELYEIRRVGLKAPVTVIPNGIDMPDLIDADHPRKREVLYLGRIHPKKGIEVLIRAWARIANRKPDWHLRIIGHAEAGHDRELEVLAGELNAPRVSIEGPRYGAERLAAYQSASFFALPTKNENFAMVVAEALAAELPVIVSRGAPWSGLEDEGCGWWINRDVETFAATLDKATSLTPGEIRAMGKRGRAWMLRSYSWAPIAADMLDVYRWMANGGPTPKTVHF
jgi:glycosyltransferase involved in cell wall biosynthesis